MSDPLLDPEFIIKASVGWDVYVFGGAAMALAYDARRAARDIAIFQHHGVALDQAELRLASWAFPRGG